MSETPFSHPNYEKTSVVPLDSSTVVEVPESPFAFNPDDQPEMESRFKINPEINSALRQYSKDDLPEERQDTLGAVRALRRARDEASGRQWQIDKHMEDIQNQVEYAAQESNEVAEHIKLLDIELSRRETSIIKRTLDLFRPAKLRQQQVDNLKTQELRQHELVGLEGQYKALVEEYEQLQQDKHYFKRAQWREINGHYRYEAAPSFYKDKTERELLELEDYKQTYGQIANVAKEKNAYFVHGLQDLGYKEGLLREDSTWVDRAMVSVSSKNPQISASSISPESEVSYAWRNTGLILGQGTIEYASYFDLVSGVNLEGERIHRFSPHANVGEYNKAIEEAIEKSRDPKGVKELKPHNKMHNEFIVERARAVGVFVLLSSRYVDVAIDPNSPISQDYTFDKLRNNVNPDVFDTWQLKDVFSSAQQLGLPVFGFFNGNPSVAHHLELDSENGTAKSVGIVSPQEMADLPVLELSAEAESRVGDMRSDILKVAAA